MRAGGVLKAAEGYQGWWMLRTRRDGVWNETSAFSSEQSPREGNLPGYDGKERGAHTAVSYSVRSSSGSLNQRLWRLVVLERRSEKRRCPGLAQLEGEAYGAAAGGSGIWAERLERNAPKSGGGIALKCQRPPRGRLVSFGIDAGLTPITLPILYFNRH